MDIVIVAVGRLKSGPESELCARYLDRARKSGRGLGLRAFEVQELGESRASRAADRVGEEEAALLNVLGKDGKIVCLDEGGDLVGSEAFARALGRDADAGMQKTTFVIGGPDGLGETLKAGADSRLALGRLTWPHQIVRVLLAEQLYRAMTILSGHPYHRA